MGDLKVPESETQPGQNWEGELRERLNEMLSQRLGPLASELTTLQSTLNAVIEGLVKQAKASAATEAAGVEEQVRQWFNYADLRHQAIADDLRAQLATSEADIAALNDAIAEIDRQRSQAGVLTVLLDAAIKFATRATVFTVRKDTLTGWKSRRFPVQAEDNLDEPVLIHSEAARLLDDVVRSQKTVTAKTEGERDNVAIPLIVRAKVVAVLFADNEPNGRLEVQALEVLMRATAMAIELLPVHRTLEAAADRRLQPRVEMTLPTQPPSTASTPLTMPLFDAAQTRKMTEEEKASAHSSARRFARFLVSEIKVYNSTRVREGTRKLDLYDRLKDEIESRRTIFDRNVDGRVTAEFDYFNDELVRTLAEGDESRLGRAVE